MVRVACSLAVVSSLAIGAYAIWDMTRFWDEHYEGEPLGPYYELYPRAMARIVVSYVYWCVIPFTFHSILSDASVLI